MAFQRTVTVWRGRPRARASGIVAAMLVLVGLAAACGDSAESAADPPTTTEATTTVPPTTTAPVSWADADEILSTGTEQVLPDLPELIALIDAENAALGATDNVHYDEEDQAHRVAIEAGECTQAAYATFFYDSTADLLDVPGVGILAPSVTASVCPDDEGAAARAEFWFGLTDIDQGPCPVDERDEAGLGLLVCPRQPGDELKYWAATAVGMTDRVLFWISADLGPATDPAAGGASLDAILDALIAHVDARLA